MDVSVIIVNYNTKELTKKCLDSIFVHTSEISFEVILVDNASTDGSVEFFANDKRIKFIASQENLGFGKANNLGFKVATGHYIFLLNSDTLFLNNAIKIFFDTFTKIPLKVACLGTLLKDTDMNITHSFGHFPTVFSVLKDALHVYLPFLKYRPCKKLNIDSHYVFFEVDYITGADLFIRKTVIDDLGLFDPDFFMYFEETEMQYRYHKKNYKSAIINTPSIIHIEGASGKNIKKTYKVNNMFTESCFLYLKKTNSIQMYIFFRIIFLLLRIFPIMLKPIPVKSKLDSLFLLFRIN